MHCWDLTYEKLGKKKERKALPGFELGTSGLQGQCSKPLHYGNIAASPIQKMSFIQFCAVLMEATGTGMRSGYVEKCVVARVCRPCHTQRAYRGSNSSLISLFQVAFDLPIAF